MFTRSLAAITLTAALAIVPTVSAQAASPVHPVTACAQEDSNGCYWDAAHRGNGSGRSFYANEQGVITAPPRAAVVSVPTYHRLSKAVREGRSHLSGYLFVRTAKGVKAALLG